MRKGLFFMILAVFTACENPDGVYYFYDIVNKELECCDEDACASVYMTYPRFKPVNPTFRQMNQRVSGELYSYLQIGDVEEQAEENEMFEFFCEAFKEAASGKVESPQNWELDTRANITQMGTETISLRINHHQFTGGAHPNSVVSYMIFDLSEPGKVLDPLELILDRDALLEKVEAAFREHHKVEDGISLSEDGRFFLDKDSIFLPSAMGYEGKDWVMVYNTYEVAPYSMGQTVLSFSLDELKGIVKGWK
ncbi:DUF3298 and DUF4163 domain-containing protein [Pleomorphovibrio marinus]|uniref:DUF3298 and DUF4163 domain-containing protein n=1 Tax=Pleomorphovibrio marinus TaxID=2164132 RepID=UPI000E0A2659|nr:DUF3298 and DUF4163 domain-containing protein [Pleomorphovibrio marinus]